MFRGDPQVENWWVALVTFERRSPERTEFLPDHYQGAVGWMACHTPNEDDIRDLIETALNAIGLRLIEIANQARIQSLDDTQQLDTHLVTNMAALEPGKVVVWGTIHFYRADGEA